MTSTNFAQANSTFGPPPDLTDTQCNTIYAYQGRVERGSVEGSPIVVVAWKPDARELARIAAGEPIFLSCLGGLPPHFLSTSFAEAANPA